MKNTIKNYFNLLKKQIHPSSNPTKLPDLPPAPVPSASSLSSDSDNIKPSEPFSQSASTEPAAAPNPEPAPDFSSISFPLDTQIQDASCNQPKPVEPAVKLNPESVCSFSSPASATPNMQSKSSNHTKTVSYRTRHKPELVPYSSSLKPRFLERFAAFDVETTGVHRTNDRIIEIGCTVFEHGEAVESFCMLVNPEKHIPSRASSVNHIYDHMVAQAPKEGEALRQFKRFLEIQFPDEILLCAHNAPFDFAFLKNALERNNIPLSFQMVDTLRPCKACLSHLENHKQPTLAKYYHVPVSDAHRAGDDAKVCGTFFLKAIAAGDLDVYQSAPSKAAGASVRSSSRSVQPKTAKPIEGRPKESRPRKMPEAPQFSDLELGILSLLYLRLKQSGFNTNHLRAGKQSSGLIEYGCNASPSIRFKSAKAGYYFLILNTKVPRSMVSQTKEGSKSECGQGPDRNVRVFVHSAQDIQTLFPLLSADICESLENRSSQPALSDAQMQIWHARTRQIADADLAAYLPALENAKF